MVEKDYDNAYEIDTLIMAKKRGKEINISDSEIE